MGLSVLLSPYRNLHYIPLAFSWAVDLSWDSMYLWFHSNRSQTLDCRHQDLFIQRITKTITKSSKLSKRKKRGWFTKEDMIKKLQWGGSLSLSEKSLGFSITNLDDKWVLIGVSTHNHWTQGKLKWFPIPNHFMLIKFLYPSFRVWCCLDVPGLRQYIKGVIEYCEKPGNERLWKILDSINPSELILPNKNLSTTVGVIYHV